MKLTPLLSFTFIIALLAAGCSNSLRIVSDYDSEAQLDQFATYALVTEPMSFPDGASPIHKQRINEAINREFQSLVYTPAEQADLKIYWLIVIDHIETERVHQTYNKWEYQVHEHKLRYKQGSLIINVVDSSTNKVIWHGKTSERVDAGMPDIEEKINRAVEGLVLKFSQDIGVSTNTPISDSLQ